jgi:hypothetical protein
MQNSESTVKAIENMELIRRAAFSGQTDLGVEVNVNRATKLLRMFTNMTEVLSRYKGTAGAVPSCAVATDYQQATGGTAASTSTTSLSLTGACTGGYRPSVNFLRTSGSLIPMDGLP